MECLICKRIRKKWFDINLSYGAGENTIKDDIIEFVGESVREYLHDNQSVCGICLNMLDEIVASKHEVFMAIVNGEKKYVPKLGNIWTIHLRKCAEDNYGDLTPGFMLNTSSLSTVPRESTPVMYLSKTKPYNQSQERLFEQREYLKQEVKDTDARSEWSCKSEGRPPRRKGKKGFRPKSAMIQKMKKHLEDAEMDTVSLHRPYSSTSSLLSFPGGDEDRSEKGSKRKRRAKEDDDEEPEEVLELKCWDDSCDHLDFRDKLALYTSHRIEMHHEKPYYACWVCGCEYFTQQHLDIHLRKHQFPPALCGICGSTQNTVRSHQKHVEQHLKQSFECFVCKLSFLTKKECNSHVFHKHRYRRLFMERRKQTPLKEHGIVDQKIYKNENQTPSKPVDSTTTETKSYKAIIMDNICDHQEEIFKPMSYKEFYLAQKLGPSESAAETSSPKPLSLGDDMVCKGSGVNTFQLELGLDITADNSMSNYGGTTTYSPARRRSRCSTSMSVMSGRSTSLSGRSTPYSTYNYDRSNIPSDDDTSRSDLPPWSGYLSGRRDLESRTSDLCSEVAHYLDRQSPSQNASKPASPLRQYEEEQSDIDTEYPPLY